MKKLMIIDDELAILDILEKYLSRSGKLIVESYSNPDIAIFEAKNKDFDIILTDIMMPSIDGMQILEEIKNSKPKTKVILMTAYNTQSKIDKSKLLNVDGYLEKPFNNLKEVENLIFSSLNI